MKEQYIVSFEAGTSGRFVCSVLWNLLNDSNFNITLTDNNSVHKDNPWKTSILYNNEIISSEVMNSPKVYSLFEFSKDKNSILQTHTYPDFTTIKKRYPKAKTIIITFDKDDLLEVVVNSLFKNLTDSNIRPDLIGLLKKSTRYSDTKFLKIIDSYNEISDKDKEYLKFFCASYLISKNEHYSFLPFINDRVSDDSVLELSYKDLFKKDDNSFVGLQKLCKFTNKSPSTTTLDMYNKYVEGRTIFIEDKTEWMKEASYLASLGSTHHTSIWPNMYVYKAVFSSSNYPLQKNMHYMKSNIYPNLYPHARSEYLLGCYSEEDPESYMPKYMTPAIWPNINFSFATSFYTLGKSDPGYYYMHDINYGTRIQLWPNIYNGKSVLILGNTIDNDPIYNITLTQQEYEGPINTLSDYVVVSMGGTLDDILLPTLWSAENNLYRGFETINRESPWLYTIDLSKTNNTHNHELYEKFEFTYVNHKDYNSNYIGLLSTVQYPNFSVLYKRYPDVRTILISFDQDDILEIMTNTVYNIWLTKSISDFQLARVKRLYREFYNKEITDLLSLDKEFIDYWINQLYDSAINHPTIKTYMNPEVPVNKNVLILKYKDFTSIENGSYVAITKLSKFIKSRITEDVIDKYILAVQKHQTFIENYCPKRP